MSPSKVFEEVCTLPLFGGGQGPKVVVVRRAEELIGTAGGRDLMERGLPRVPKGAVLVLECSQAGNIRTTGFYKALQKAGAVISCDPLRSSFGPESPDSKLGVELDRRARALGMNMTPGAVMALIQRAGQDLGVLDEELAKLSLTLGGSEKRKVEVGEKEVKEVCSASRLGDAFEFAEALAAKDKIRSLESLGAIFAHGLGDNRKPGKVVSHEAEIAIRLLAIVTWKFGQLQDLRARLDQGMNEYQAFGAAKVPFPARQGMSMTIRKHSASSLRSAIQALLQANFALRTGQDRLGILEQLVWDLCKKP